MSNPELHKSQRYKVGKFLEKWWFKALEIVAFILLLTKLVPEKLLEEAKATGWALVIILGVSVLSLLLINYLLTLGYAKEIARREISFSAELDNTKADFNNRLSSLGEINAALEKKARYADVIPMLNDAFQELHNALRRDYQDKTKYHEPFVVFCQNLEKVFSHITGVECHVCIKMTIFPKGQIPNASKMEKMLNNLQVKTYCRSNYSSSIRKQIDQTTFSHPIKENTDFEFVFKDLDICFFSNDLAKIDEYKNSSFKPKSGGSCTYFPAGTPFEERAARWPLNYRTTIVSPIRPLIKEVKEEHNILGLLCVDSSSPDVFNEILDKHIMIGCADGVYNSFKKLFLPTETSSNQTKPNKLSL